MSHITEEPTESDPLEFLTLGRRIRHGLTSCTGSIPKQPPGDIFYLWIQLSPTEGDSAITQDQWLNIIDEAASIGVNWLVLTLGYSEASRAHAGPICRWAHESYDMTICLHVPDGTIHPDERELLQELPRESTYLLVEPPFATAFGDLTEEGIQVALANPPSPGEGARCDYPYKMIFVDAAGELYTCGLVSGEHDFFLGSVFDGSLEEIIHNPKLPHTVSAAQPSSHQSCSGCPPLVAKYLCHK